MAWYYVIIDLPQLRQKLSIQLEQDLSEDHAVDWLKRQGFQEAGSGWLLEARTLPALDGAVVQAAWRLLNYYRQWPWSYDTAAATPSSDASCSEGNGYLGAEVANNAGRWGRWS